MLHCKVKFWNWIGSYVAQDGKCPIFFFKNPSILPTSPPRSPSVPWGQGDTTTPPSPDMQMAAGFPSAVVKGLS